MSKYVLKFSKTGYMKYTSHLDMLRLFQRAFKRCGIKLAHSQGFNPHPKMGFAQPLSLGYTAEGELLEFETMDNYIPADLKDNLKSVMPKGIDILACSRLDQSVKSLAAIVDEAQYIVEYPVPSDYKEHSELLNKYLAQESIKAYKRQKKTKKMVEVDIKNKIRNIEILEAQNLTLKLTLDCGSTSNLSPEQVIASFTDYCKLNVERYSIEVNRTSISFEKNLKF